MPGQLTFGGIDMTVRRNAFGRQVDSFESDITLTGVVPPAFHDDLTSPRFRNCTICHQKIHGSYIDRNLLR